MHAQLNLPVHRALLLYRPRVALRRHRVHLGRRTAHDRLRHAQHRAAELDLLADPAPLAPGRRAGEPDIGPEAPAMAAGAHPGLIVAQAGDVDQAHHLATLVAEAVAGNIVEDRLAADLVAQVVG